MSKPSTLGHTPAHSTRSSLDIPASRSAWPDSEKAKMMNGTYGRTSSGLSERSATNCDGVFSRTFPAILPSASKPYSMPYTDWVSGLRLAYSQRKKSALRMKDSECSSWPTAKAVTGGANSNRKARGAGGPDLQEAVKNWPTPSAMQDTKGDAALGAIERREELGKQIGLAHRARQFPHPAPATAKRGLPSSEWRPTSRRLLRSVTSRVALTSLRRWLRRGNWRKRRLNPLFVEWLMGWPPGHALCGCSETEFTRWQLHMRGALSALPTASAGWIWNVPDDPETDDRPAQLALL
jgi:hypothetical protein